MLTTTRHSRLRTLLTCCAGTLVLTLTLGLTPSLAAPPIDHESILKRWQATETVRRQASDGIYEGKLLERFVSFGSTPVYGGNISFVRVPKKPDFQIKQIAEAMREATGLEHWRSRQTGKAHVFEAEWPALRRTIRLYVREEGTSYSLSIAFFRTIFYGSIGLESELIQRHLADVAQPRASWVDRLVASADWLGPRPAFADTPCPCGDTEYDCQATCRLDLLSDRIADMSNRLGDTNKNWNDTNEELGKLGKHWGDMNKNWADSNRVIGDTNSTLRRTNDLLAQFIDPDHAFVWAAASAGGMAIGALAANIAADILMKAGTAAWNFITDAKKNAQILERFKKARDLIVEVNKSAAQLDELLSRLLDFKNRRSTQGLPAEVLLDRLSMRQELIEADIRKTRGLLDSADTEKCRMEYATQLSALKKKSEQMASLIENLRDYNDAKLCQTLKATVQSALGAQVLLQQAAGSVYGGRDLFAAYLAEKNEESRKEFARGRSIALKTWREKYDLADDTEAKGRADMDAFQRKWESECRMRKTREIPILGSIPLIGRVAGSIKGVEWKCREEFENSNVGIYARTQITNAHAAAMDMKRGADAALKREQEAAFRMRPNPAVAAEEMAQFDQAIQDVIQQQVSLDQRFESLKAKQRDIFDTCLYTCTVLSAGRTFSDSNSTLEAARKGTTRLCASDPVSIKRECTEKLECSGGAGLGK